MLWGGSAPDQIVPFTSGPGESSPLSTWVPAQPPALISLVINILRLHLPGTAQHNKSGVTSVLPDISELYLVSPSLTALVLFLINWSLAWGGLRTEDWGLDKSLRHYGTDLIMLSASGGRRLKGRHCRGLSGRSWFLISHTSDGGQGSGVSHSKMVEKCCWLITKVSICWERRQAGSEKTSAWCSPSVTTAGPYLSIFPSDSS